MRIQSLSLLLIAITCLATNAAGQNQDLADSPSEETLESIASADVLEILKSLESDSFDERERATKTLIARGPEVKQVVEIISRQEDEELRYRCKQILDKIADNQHLLQQDAFLAGDVDQLVRNVSCWKRFEKMLGNNQKTRQLFLQMQNEGEDLLELYERNPSQCSARICELYLENNQLRRFGKGLDLGVHTAVIFVASDEKIDLDTKAMSYSCSMCYNIKTTPFAENKLFLELMGKMVTRSTATDAQMYQYARLSKFFKLKEAREIALKLIASESASASYRATSLIDLGTELGTKEDIPVIAKLIKNDTQLYRSSSKSKPQATYKLGDTALAMAVKLSGQDTADYNFTDYYQGKAVTTINYRRFGFKTEEERTAARGKWEFYSPSKK